MNVVIRAIAFANGEHCPHAGQWLKSFDHEAYNGRGYAEYTTDLAKAMQFSSPGEALAFWNKQSVIKPLRPDGLPNKPLTALTMVLENVT